MSRASLRPALVALAGGRPVRIGKLNILAIETTDDEALDRLDPGACANFLLSAERAAALGLGNRRENTPGVPLVVRRSDWMNTATVRAIADAGQDFDRFTPGVLEPMEPVDVKDAAAALTLARLAGLAPALWLLDNAEADIEVLREWIESSPDAVVAARARLPIADIGETQVIAFRERATGDAHVALVIGQWGTSPPLVRLHSECLTGDVFGSLKCDCGPQLHEALRLIKTSGGGILLYLRQEGRGIGIVNKIRAYALQDRGLDTVDANRRLGFADDERDYGVAAAILRAMKVGEVRLLTNNPGKVAGLESAGIVVAERVAHHMPVNPHNADYIATKKSRSGHLD
ncbi:GTP cyclohydrolase II [Sphingomonas sp. HDW15A]|uniref:GTP cyclohydrolase II n=1 Tax=Sphingomonas sp. HDW15A TaxID=2714942 RepID=UPI00140D392A|nr:GTP cyclohydrolase II [Sphingomonas sp. HDW15A]QIK96952.1 GTP cyclohydrolase II [Sphingomonas sp. HDW15A]